MAIEGDRHSAGFFSPGDSLSASHLNDLAGHSSRSSQLYSSNGFIAQGTFGTVDLGNGQQMAAQSMVSDYPFKVSVQAGETAGTWKVYVRAGTVNNMVTKVLNGPSAGKYLDSTPTPYLELNSASGSMKYVVLRCTKEEGSAFFPKKTDVYLVDDLEALADSESEGHLLIASLTLSKTGPVISTIQSVNQYIYSCQNLIRVKGGSQTVWNWTSR